MRDLAATARAARRPRGRARHRRARAASLPRSAKHQQPPALLERADRQIPFGDEPDGARRADRPKPAIVKAAIVSGILRPMPASSLELDRCRRGRRSRRPRGTAPPSSAMVDDVDEAAGQAGLVGKADAERDVADLRDRRVGEHPFQVGLEHRDRARRRTSPRARAR